MQKKIVNVNQPVGSTTDFIIESQEEERDQLMEEEQESLAQAEQRGVDKEREKILKTVLKITDKGFDCICSSNIKRKFKI
ncbi:hypothetical protein KJ934_00310 [Patescibacteria group bacterium]|nr:hypothetical protein [Patescibacteria group bacterium]MBU4477459.1 hypothetical protein [Patescibacteria group bacterium]MCG2699131.1 hypothetical protein [Candidatus Parcubacteria bacterium]